MAMPGLISTSADRGDIGKDVHQWGASKKTLDLSQRVYRNRRAQIEPMLRLVS